MKRLFTNIILFTVTMTVFGQQSIGVKLNGGLSYFKKEIIMNPPVPMTQEFYPMLSVQGGLTYSYCFKNKFLLGTEIIYSQIEGKGYLKTPSSVINGVFSNEFITNNSLQHIYYLGVPIYIGYNYKKLNINLGVQTNFALASGGLEKIQASYDGQLISYDIKKDDLGINKVDFGTRLGLFYKLSDKFSLETNYYCGLTNLIKGKSFFESPIWQVQQLTIGLRYNLLILDRNIGETKNK
jgi:hypothetical protein